MKRRLIHIFCCLMLSFPVFSQIDINYEGEKKLVGTGNKIDMADIDEDGIVDTLSYDFPPYDTLTTFYVEKHQDEYVKNPRDYNEFKRLFKQITPGIDAVYIELQDAAGLSENSPFNIYADSEKKIVTQTYIPGYNGIDIFIVLIYEFLDGGEFWKGTELWIFEDGVFKANHLVAYGYENEGGSCDQSFQFNADTTFVIDYSMTPSAYACGFSIPITEKYQMKCSIGEEGCLVKEKIFDIEYSSPCFYPDSVFNWKSEEENYPLYPIREEPWGFHNLGDISPPVEGYFYVSESEEAAYSITFFTKDKQNNIVDEFTISLDKNNNLIHTKKCKEKSELTNPDNVIQPAVIKTCVGDVYLMPDGKFMFQKLTKK